MSKPLDLIGLGIGPFNLSLASLLSKVPSIESLFFDKKPNFDWHPEVMFKDSDMQTSYLKDLVTPVDPTHPHSFLNYLANRGLFYHFMNTQRSHVSRREFEQYCQWVSSQQSEKLKFNTEIRSVKFQNDLFKVETSKGTFESKNICVATGLTPRVPEFARSLIGPKIFHAKSAQLKDMNLEGKSVVIVGGGQTGIEIFRNALHNKWGRPHSLKVVTRRKNLEPLDESAFANDYFTPGYVETFFGIAPEKKAQVVQSQKLASDGNTPSYLVDLYKDLYHLKHVENDARDIRILACRKVENVRTDGTGYRLEVENCFLDKKEELQADIVILSTGFENAIPQVLEPLFPMINFDSEKRFQFKKSYAISWNGPESNRIYALNFSRHAHGIVDPQTSLMAWRSAVVINDLAQKEIYNTKTTPVRFVDYE